jgi:hypothetical protein
MNYFIRRGDQQYGPYTLGDLQRYVASGNILVTDLARSEGMADWVPVSQVIGNIPVLLVSPMPSPEPVLRRDGNKLVVTRGATLPPCCVKCAQPADGLAKEKNFSWCNPLLGLLVILGCVGIVVYLVVYYVTRKQMRLTVPLCEEHRRAKRTTVWLGTLIMVLSPVLLVIAAVTDKSSLAVAGLVVLLVLLIAGAVVLFFAAPLRPKKIDDAQGVFVGVREPFLQFIESQGLPTTGVQY